MSRKITGIITTRGETTDGINFTNQEGVEYTVTLKEIIDGDTVEYDPVLEILGKEFYKESVETIFEDMEYLEGKDD